jgi:hypothetical protein
MEHVDITLPLELKNLAETRAREEGVSLEEFVLELLEKRLSPKSAERDPLFAKYKVFDGDAPSDLAENHDKYLYDE